MSEKMQETIADIIAEMRGARTEFPFVYLMGEPDTPEVIDPKTKKIIEPRKINIRRVTVKELADRLKAALAAPPRNCDVGTAEEQVKRWAKFCTAHHKKWIGGKIPTGPCECPCYEGNSCNYFLWAQLPYESEATDGK